MQSPLFILIASQDCFRLYAITSTEERFIVNFSSVFDFFDNERGDLRLCFFVLIVQGKRV